MVMVVVMVVIDVDSDDGGVDKRMLRVARMMEMLIAMRN